MGIPDDIEELLEGIPLSKPEEILAEIMQNLTSSCSRTVNLPRKYPEILKTLSEVGICPHGDALLQVLQQIFNIPGEQTESLDFSLDFDFCGYRPASRCEHALENLAGFRGRSERPNCMCDRLLFALLRIHSLQSVPKQEILALLSQKRGRKKRGRKISPKLIDRYIRLLKKITSPYKGGQSKCPLAPK